MAGSGVIDRIQGRLKAAYGRLAGAEAMKREGRTDQTAGRARERAHQGVDRARDAITPEKE